jgi:hypothetical protein
MFHYINMNYYFKKGKQLELQQKLYQIHIQFYKITKQFSDLIKLAQ